MDNVKRVTWVVAQITVAFALELSFNKTLTVL